MITAEHSQGLFPTLAPYVQSLILRPGGEIYYKFRALPPSKSKGAFVSSSLKSPYERKDLAGLPLSEAVASLLGSNAKFHPNSESSPKTIKNGFGAMPEKCPNFTRDAKNSIRWAAAAIEQEFGIGRCVFLTGTLPGSTAAANLAFAQNSSWFLDRINKWLLKNFPIDGEIFRISVWEIQKRGALHLHLLAVAPVGMNDKLIAAFQIYWIHLLEFLSDSLGIDLFERGVGGSWRDCYDKMVKIRGKRKPLKDIVCYGATVLKSVASYLSKYLSKSAGDFRFGAPIPIYYPARWWSISRAAQRLIAAQTIKIPLPRFHLNQLENVHALVEIAFAPHKWGKSNASLPTFSEAGEFTGFQETHVGYMCWAAPDVAKEVLLSLGEYMNCYLADNSIKADNDLRTYIVNGLTAGKNRLLEIQQELSWDVITRKANRTAIKIQQSIALHEIRLYCDKNGITVEQDENGIALG